MEEFVSNHHASLVSVENPSEINFIANRYVLPHGEMWFSSYGTPVTIEVKEGDAYCIRFLYKGSASIRAGGHEHVLGPQQGVISRQGVRIHCGKGYQQIALKINRASVVNKLSALIGKPLLHPPEFAAVFDSAAPQNRSLLELFNFLLRGVNTLVGLPTLMLPDLEQALIVSLLCSCAHNYSEMLFGQPAKAAPWQVHRVEEYIEANWNKPLAIEDIVDVSGSSARSVFRAFKQSRGYSPMEFARQVRLKHARAWLLHAEKNMTVTQVALACGFSDLGRFSKSYAESFGELPSETLLRGKRNSNA